MKTKSDILSIRKADQSRLPEYLKQDKPMFGREFSDHMLVMNLYCEDWQDEIAQVVSAEILPYGPVALLPATVGHHYSQIVFEGFMAYQDPKGLPHIFRPHDHLYRFNQGAQRLAMPLIDNDFLLSAIGKLVQLDLQWIDPQTHRALYLRPLLFAAEPFIGVRHDIKQFKLIVMAAPHISYGEQSLKLYVPRPAANGTGPEFMRSYPGGTGDIKAAANYAGTIAPLRTAAERGCNDILWLDPTGTHVEEAGTSNVFFLIDGKIVTPPLDGTILPGITRDSVITLLRDRGIVVEERCIRLEELLSAGEKLQEGFVTGTAATIKPISSIDAPGRQITLPIGDDSLANRLKKELQAIKWGQAVDDRGWNWRVE